MNIFAKKFEEPKADFPNQVLGKLIEPFETAADNYASLIITEIDRIARLTAGFGSLPFQFQLVLRSSELKGYSFEVSRFAYDVTLYPTQLQVEDDIALEIGATGNFLGVYQFATQTEQEFSELTIRILQSHRFGEVVGGVVKIARARAEERLGSGDF